MNHRASRLTHTRTHRWRDRPTTILNAPVAPGFQPLVQTDLLDYAPGSTATITASRFAVGETVEFQVIHLDPGLDQQYGTADDVSGDNSGQGHLPWSITDGGAGDLDGVANGRIVTQWYVNPDDSAGATFKLTATGQRSQRLATTIFTDSVVFSPLRLDDPATPVGSLADGSKTVFFARYAGSPQGTGVINSFLTLSPKNQSTTESGFNCIGIPLSALAKDIITIGGKGYYEFRLDLNESTSNPQITLSKLQVYASSSLKLNSLSGLTPLIDLQGDPNNPSQGIVKLNAALGGGTGSGTGDLLFYLPTDIFPTKSYIYLNAALTGADAGFEEFSYSTTPIGSTFPIVDLAVTKDDGKVTAIPGSATTYTITVTNQGPSTVNSLTLIDTLPSALLNPTFTPSVGTYNPSTGLWSGLSLASNQSVTLTLNSTISPTATGTLTNSVKVTAPGSVIELNTANNVASDVTTLIPAVKLSLTTAFSEAGLKKVLKSQFTNPVSSAPEFQLIALPDQTVSFTIVVKNDGAATAQNVTVFDDLTKLLPIGLKVLSVNAGGGIDLDTDGNSATGDGNSQTLEVTFDSIAPGASKTITVSAKVSSEGPNPQASGTTTSYITPIDFQGILGSVVPESNTLDQAIPEYHNVPISGKFYLHPNLTKTTGQSTVSFQNLNITLADPTIVNPTPGTTVQIVQPNTVTKRLDVATTDLRGTLNNGQPLTIQAVENIFNGDNTPMVFDADLGGTVKAYPTSNQSGFLPPTDVGEALLNLIWRKPSYPSFTDDFNTWTNAIAGDGNLTNASDEKAVIDYFINKFINKGAGDVSLFESGSFKLTNLTTSTSASITARAGQFTPTTPDYTIVVTNTSVKVIAPNQSTQTYSSLQTALSSLNFAQPTGVMVQVSGSSSVLTKLQTFSNSDPSKNWTIQQVKVDSGVSKVTFKSANGAANINFASTNFVLGNPNTVISIEGDNSADILIGSQLKDTLVGNNGGDFLDGQGGSDILCGGNGPDIFVLRRGDGTDTISDFETSSDKIGLASGLTFNQLILSGNTIAVKNNLNQPSEVLATLTGINTSTLNQSNFVTV
ncbi:MAG TPA: hypothetical protein V6C78_04905 [Crinalium sp.]